MVRMIIRCVLRPSSFVLRNSVYTIRAGEDVLHFLQCLRIFFSALSDNFKERADVGGFCGLWTSLPFPRRHRRCAVGIVAIGVIP